MRKPLLIAGVAVLAMLAVFVLITQFLGRGASEDPAGLTDPTPDASATPTVRGDEFDTIHRLERATEVVSAEGGFSFTVPADHYWLVCGTYQALVLVSQDEASLTGMCDSDAYAPMNFYAVNDNAVNVQREAEPFQSDYRIDFGDVAGTRAVRTQFVFNDAPLGEDDFFRPQAGVTSVTYQFYLNGKTYRAEYLSEAGGTAGLADFEAMVKSFSLTP